MSQTIFERLVDYFESVGSVLKGSAKPSAVFPNASDKGTSRERVYAEFLRTHTPNSCTTSFGGFLFDDEGSESRQLDVLVMTNTAPRFDFDNADGTGKSFSHVEGCIAVACLKSSLNKNEIYDSLENIASIPLVKPLADRQIFGLGIKADAHEDWPLKIVYSPEGCSVETALRHIDDFYLSNQTIPIGRRPNVIHVAGNYYLSRITEGITFQPGPTPVVGAYGQLTSLSDFQALLYVVDEIQNRSVAAQHILYQYRNLWRQVTDAACIRLAK
jgi:hypothetical protein